MVEHQQLPAVRPFEFEGASVRIIELSGGPWFVLIDVCRVSGIANAARAADRLEADEKGVHSMNTPGGPQYVTIISESGLYSLILTSQKAAAKRFRRWVTGEVIPEIRKTGSYGAAAGA